MINGKEVSVPIFYQSFLLRIWKNSAPNYIQWHASLEDPSNHALRTFNHPQDLFSYLLEISNFEEQSEKKEGKENED